MTLRPAVLIAALVAAAPAQAEPSATPSPAETNAAPPAQRLAAPRKPVRARPGVKSRVIDAPGAALMVIPAAYHPTTSGGFQRL